MYMQIRVYNISVYIIYNIIHIWIYYKVYLYTIYHLYILYMQLHIDMDIYYIIYASNV